MIALQSEKAGRTGSDWCMLETMAAGGNAEAGSCWGEVQM